MIFSAVIPVTLSGTRPGQGHRGVRRHSFWQELDVRMRSVGPEEAPLVASWNAAFDERLVFRTSRAEWGTYPDDGYQIVRHYDGLYWRRAMNCDLLDTIVGGPRSSPIVDAAAFTAAFARPEKNLVLSSAPLATPGPRKPVIRDIRAHLELVQTWGPDHTAHEALLVALANVTRDFILVDDIVYTRCVEPMLELSDCPVTDRAGKCSLLVRVITDREQVKWRAEKTPDRLFPLSDFDEAMTAVAEADFDPAFGVDRDTGADFNEIRRPEIARPDLLTSLDFRAFHALCHMRRFANECDRTERVENHVECALLHRQLTTAIRDYDNGDTTAFGRIDDLIPSLHAAWSGTWMDRITENVIALLDERPVFLPLQADSQRFARFS
jgi:hypothetical protein